MKELSQKGEAETVKKVCGALVLGKEDSLKETHQGRLSAIESPFFELFLKVWKTFQLVKKASQS
ncbi:MAG: hypothetical protein II458_07695, partial [Oscillospiraceae bacterium]|nr:hypothetical protein [Oscillospiraceae bacterium]